MQFGNVLLAAGHLWLWENEGSIVGAYKMVRGINDDEIFVRAGPRPSFVSIAKSTLPRQFRQLHVLEIAFYAELAQQFRSMQRNG
jgi:hypothetical protein